MLACALLVARCSLLTFADRAPICRHTATVCHLQETLRSRWSSPFAAEEAGPTPQVDEDALVAVLLQHEMLRCANEERFNKLQAERKVRYRCARPPVPRLSPAPATMQHSVLILTPARP